MEERGDEGDMPRSYQIRENRKPVERLGFVSIILQDHFMHLNLAV